MIEIEDPEDTMMMTLTKIKHSMIEEEEVGTTEEALDNQEEEETEMEIEGRAWAQGILKELSQFPEENFHSQ